MRLKSIKKQQWNNPYFLLVFLLILPFTVQAQEAKTAALPLLSYLPTLEKQFQVRFSYNPTLLEDLELPARPDQKDLNGILRYISEKTPVRFFQINERYIAVQRLGENLYTVCGTLLDAASGAPIANASILGNSTGTETDENGTFRLSNISENEALSIYYSGILLKIVEASELLASTGQCAEVLVNRNFNFLPTVVLNSYFSKGISKNASGSITISNKNFDILPNLTEPDILQIVQVLPGVESADESASNINIRGGNSDETLLLWDDVRMYQSGHFFGLISAFNPNLTQQVTVYKNGTNPRFGETLSGVISMESDNEIPEAISGGVGVNLISANGYAKIPVSENISFNVSGRTSINTGIGNPVYNEFFNRAFQNTVVTNLQNNTSQGVRSTDENFNFYDVNIKALWDISEKDKLRYNFLSIFNKLRFTEIFIDETTSSSNLSNLQQDTQVNMVAWHRNWSPNLKSSLLVSATEYGLEESNLEVDSNRLNERQNLVKENNVKFDVSYTLNERTLVSGGYQYTDTETLYAETAGNNGAVAVTPNELFVHAFFANARLQFFQKKTVVTFGARATDYNNLGQFYWEPRANIYHSLSKSIRVYAAAERKYQAIYQLADTESQLLGVENRRWIAANGVENKVLESTQVSAGAVFSKRGWTATLEGFNKKVTGILAANQGFRNQFRESGALGSYTSYGLEFSLNKRLDKFNAWFSYTYMDNEYQFTDLEPSTFPHRLDIAHSARVAATYEINNFTVALGTHFRTGTPYTKPIPNNPLNFDNGQPTINYSRPNAETVASYFRTDASAKYEFKIDGTFNGTLHLSLLNIFDRRNPLDTYYRIAEDEAGNATVNRVDQFSLGFTPNLSFNLLF